MMGMTSEPEKTYKTPTIPGTGKTQRVAVWGALSRTVCYGRFSAPFLVSQRIIWLVETTARSINIFNNSIRNY